MQPRFEPILSLDPAGTETGGHRRFASVALLASLTLVFAFSGCASVKTTTRAHRATLADNTQDFDRYVERRTNSLTLMGVTKDRNEAEFQARTEATRRYGERVPEYSSSWSWGGSKKPALTLADYDKMTREAAKAR